MALYIFYDLGIEVEDEIKVKGFKGNVIVFFFNNDI